MGVEAPVQLGHNYHELARGFWGVLIHEKSRRLLGIGSRAERAEILLHGQPRQADSFK